MRENRTYGSVRGRRRKPILSTRLSALRLRSWHNGVFTIGEKIIAKTAEISPKSPQMTTVVSILHFFALFHIFFPVFSV
jgi:hypothetical protein